MFHILKRYDVILLRSYFKLLFKKKGRMQITHLWGKLCDLPIMGMRHVPTSLRLSCSTYMVGDLM
jgi:hypothetical protein